VSFVQTRVFRRIIPDTTVNHLHQAIDSVSEEVNTFLASLPTLGDALDIQTNVVRIGRYVAYVVTITYVEA